MKKMVEEVMKNFDENNDGMIEFNEMKNLLNVEDNVLTELSLTKNLSTQQFNTIFDYYDNDSELNNRSNQSCCEHGNWHCVLCCLNRK